MKQSKYYLMVLLFACTTEATAQKITQGHLQRLLTVEPSVGIHTNFGTDVLLSTLVQWSPRKRLAFTSYSCYSINNVTQRNFNYITTDYNYSLNQKFGVGTNLYAKKTVHSFFLMAGVKYTAYQETLNNPDLDKATSTISSVSPDYGFMYSLKKGVRNCFFTFRAYIPLYPWPIKGSDIQYVDGNMNHIALEFGVGVKIK